MRVLLVSLAALLGGCDAPPAAFDPAPFQDTGTVDVDGDGAPVGEDCADEDATRYPGAREVCDGVDQDCDGEVDEQVEFTFWRDLDGDGYGSVGATIRSCTLPGGYAPRDGDCDDGDPAVNPDAREVCDDVDQDCDGEADDGVTTTMFADADRDGFGDPQGHAERCVVDAGWTLDASDCDDRDEDAFPGAPETCDGDDDDCDGLADEDDAADAPTWHADADADGFGDPATATRACAVPAGFVADASDCDDADTAVLPGGTETCDGVDQDCDGATDEDAVDAPTWYADADGDGFGDAGAPAWACAAPVGTVADATDCDDADPTTSPSAAEVCGGADEDCDGTVDEPDAVDAADWYADADGDGFGDPVAPLLACDAPAGAVADATDCDDADGATSPAGVETCDGRDEDCDGVADDDAADAPPWYADADGDGLGDPDAVAFACEAPASTVADASDCDDADPAVTDGWTWYLDADGDGFGDPGVDAVACEAAAGWVADATDCDDGDLETHPDAAEVCADGVDQDCNGAIDDACTVHCGAVTADETWGPGVHEVRCDVVVAGAGGPTLTIEDGAEVRFGTGLGLVVGDTAPGTLVVAGGATGVTFTSAAASPAAGDWLGLTFGTYDGGSVVQGATVAYAGHAGEGSVVVASTAGVTLAEVDVRDGGGDGLRVEADAVAAVTDATVSDHAGTGVVVDDDGTLAAFTDNAITGNAGSPVELPPDGVDALDATSSFAGNGVDGVAVRAGDVERDVGWPKLDVDYRVLGRVRVRGGSYAAPATLRLEDGVTVRFDAGAGLHFGDVGHARFVALGLVDGIVLTSSQATPAPGDWDGVRLQRTASGNNVLQGVTVEYGGGSGYPLIYVTDDAMLELNDATLRGSGDHGLEVYWGSATIRDVVFEDNADHGVVIGASGDLTADASTGEAFSRNTFTGNAGPVSLRAELVRWLDTTSAFTGNVDDRVRVTTDNLVVGQTWRDLGVPYVVSGMVNVGGSASTVLTLEDGVRVEFLTSSGIDVAETAPGRLVAEGTVDGIVLTSGQDPPAAGDWHGVFVGRFDSGTWLDNVEIGYAGGNGANLYFDRAAGALGADDVYVHHASTWGIYRSGCAPSITNATYASNASGDVF